MREFEIFYKDESTGEGEIPSPDAEYMIREPAPGGGFIEHYFESGLDMLDYIDGERLLWHNSIPVPFSNEF